VVEHQERAVWVTLSGILDGEGLDRLIRRVGPDLARGGCRVVLEGKRLLHLDYRAVTILVRWQRRLRERGHRIWLANWSEYLQMILAMEDWQGELAPLRAYRSSWRRLTGARQTRLP
jgi:hypothetical protein